MLSSQSHSLSARAFSNTRTQFTSSNKQLYSNTAKRTQVTTGYYAGPDRFAERRVTSQASPQPERVEVDKVPGLRRRDPRLDFTVIRSQKSTIPLKALGAENRGPTLINPLLEGDLCAFDFTLGSPNQVLLVAI